MKKPVVAFCVVVLAVLGLARLRGQIVNPTPHSPTVIATYDFENLTAAISPVAIISPSDSGFYRISTYLTVGSNTTPIGGTVNVGGVCPQLIIPNDIGVLGYNAAASDLYGQPCLALQGNSSETKYGVIPLHVKRNTQVQLTSSYSASNPVIPYSLYVVVEKL